MNRNLVKEIFIKNNYDLNIAPKGLVPFVIHSRIKKDKRQLILASDMDEARAIMDTLKLTGSYYIIMDIENELTIDDTLTYIVNSPVSVITTCEARSALFPQPENMNSRSIILQSGLDVDRDIVIEMLENKGFERVDNVYERGEYAVRGFIIDIYGFISEPVRVEMFGNSIENVKTFNIETQVSERRIDRYIISPEFDRKKTPFESFFRDFTVYDMDSIIMQFTHNDQYENFTYTGRSINDFNKFLLSKDNYKVRVFSSSEYEKKRLKTLFKDKIDIINGTLLSSFADNVNREVYINDFEIFSKNRYTAEREYSQMALSLIEELEDLEPGDIVVHSVYGIGRFTGIERISLGRRTTDCLRILYKNNDKLFVPVDQIHLIDKYHSTKEAHIELSPLSREHFANKKKRVFNALKNVAGELIRLYAEREMIKGYSFPDDDELQLEMEEKFPYQETADQIRSINDVKSDMNSDRSMERLVCGEVGYGKTEVAARAIFKCVLAGKQAAVIAPTTILAEQHFRTMQDRFRDYGMDIRMLSRFVKVSERKSAIEALRNKQADIVIGTTALLSDSIEFNDLGLVIVDEEHRFGVRQKEKLKELRRNVDMLYMSATPIPRTLEMVFSGIKDISNITTPPSGRKPVKTYLINWDESAIRKAVINEINRGGQIYFVHNRIDSLDGIYDRLKKIVPEARIVTAHAKIKSAQLERIMVDFWEHRFDILLSTAIIESGIDNPNTNTMFINQGERFGIAQLHQLRGRIGRSHNDAFCYVILPSKQNLGKKARRRLAAFKSFPSLGAGFKLSMKDLEIRGAGNLLGTKQHGNIGIVGFTMYYRLLKQAVDELKGIKTPEIIEPTVNINLKTYIPDEYGLSSKGKTQIYREIAELNSMEKIRDYRRSFRDKYGPLKDSINDIFKLQEIKILCKQAKISKLNMTKNHLKMEFFADYTPHKALLNRIVSLIAGQFSIKYENPFAIIIDSRTNPVSNPYIIKLLKSII